MLGLVSDFADGRIMTTVHRPWNAFYPCQTARTGGSTYFNDMKQGSGFTLIELMVTIAIAAILLALAVPSFLNFIRDSKRSEVVNELVNSFQVARSEAVRRGQEIGICASTDGANCASDNNWSKGWIVFVNSDRDGAPNRANSEELLRAYIQPTADIALTSTSFNTGTGAVDGRYKTRTYGQSNVNGSITVCDPRGSSAARRVVVAVSGTIRVETNSISCS